MPSAIIVNFRTNQGRFLSEPTPSNAVKVCRSYGEDAVLLWLDEDRDRDAYTVAEIVRLTYRWGAAIHFLRQYYASGLLQPYVLAGWDIFTDVDFAEATKTPEQ